VIPLLNNPAIYMYSTAVQNELLITHVQEEHMELIVRELSFKLDPGKLPPHLQTQLAVGGGAMAVSLIFAVVVKWWQGKN
jgi:hypothetical protein